MPCNSSRCCPSSCPPKSSCPKKYLTGTLCAKTTTPADCFADHTPSREAYGLIIGGTAGFNYSTTNASSLSENDASKNIKCVLQTTPSTFTVVFKTGTFVCGPTAGAVLPTEFLVGRPLSVGPQVVAALGGPYYIDPQRDYDVASNSMTFNIVGETGAAKLFTVPVEFPIHVVQPKSICKLTQKKLDTDADNALIYKLSANGVDYVLATCPNCDGTAPACPPAPCCC